MELRTTWQIFNGDWQLATPGLAVEDGLQSAVIISLFTDHLADPDDLLPSGDDRRGWWGDTYADIAGDRIGSKLWLLSREKVLPAVLPRAEQYALDALQWLIDDGIAAGVLVTAEIIGSDTLGLAVEIDRPGQAPVKYQFRQFWEGN
jgi:phage gp46-like protein